LLIACLSIAATGCNAPGARTGDTEKLNYFAARGLDLMDVVEINVGAGTGLLVSAAIEPIKVGYGFYDSSKAGMMGRSCGTWDECRREMFIGLHHLNRWHKRPCFGNGYLFTRDVVHRENRLRDPNDRSRLRFYEEWNWVTRFEDHEKHWLDLGIEAHLLFLGVDATLSPQEAFDFVLGLFTVDAISHDDYEAKVDEVMEEDFRSNPRYDLPPHELPPE
ncbi:MAG: hypothetical protein V2A76_16585, partial [Planctomycetota bacterium]